MIGRGAIPREFRSLQHRSQRIGSASTIGARSGEKKTGRARGEARSVLKEENVRAAEKSTEKGGRVRFGKKEKHKRSWEKKKREEGNMRSRRKKGRAFHTLTPRSGGRGEINCKEKHFLLEGRNGPSRPAGDRVDAKPSTLQKRRAEIFVEAATRRRGSSRSSLQGGF